MSATAYAIFEAGVLLGAVALTWLWAHCNQLTPWPDFEHGMRQKFGDDIQHMCHKKHDSIAAKLESASILCLPTHQQ